MARKNKMVECLDNGTEIYTTEKGWDKEKVKAEPVQAAGWAEGNAPHFQLSKGLLLAVAKSPDKFPGVVLGNYEETPVIDPTKVVDLVLGAFCDKYDIEPETVRVATSRVTTRKNAQLEVFEVMKASGVDESILNSLKAQFGL